MMTTFHDFREDERLAVYGSLRPGGSNEHILGTLQGIWLVGTVRGELVEAGWASAHGYPAIRLSANAPRVRVHVLCSHELPRQWAMLDRFEGPEYRRSTVTVRSAGGEFPAQIYQIAERALSSAVASL